MYTVRIFMKCMHVCAAQKLIYSIKPDFPSLAEEIAEPHLDMNIKVAAKRQVIYTDLVARNQVDFILKRSSSGIQHPGKPHV